jgi:hypothetical protein
MSALSPDSPVCSCLVSDYDFALNRKISDRRRWPQRSNATPRTDAHFQTPAFDQTTLQTLLYGTIPGADSIGGNAHVNEMAIQCCRRDASAVLSRQRKRKRNDFWKARARPTEADLRLLKLIRTLAAQMLRRVHKIDPLETTAYRWVPEIPTLFDASRAERFSFSTARTSAAGIQPRSSETVSS